MSAFRKLFARFGQNGKNIFNWILKLYLCALVLKKKRGNEVEFKRGFQT